MIKSYSEIYSQINSQPPVRLAVVNPKSNYLNELLNEAKGLGWIIPVPFFSSSNQSAIIKAVNAIKDDDCQILMKGDIDTSSLMKIVLDSNYGIKKNKNLSHIAVIESLFYHKLLLISDGGVNISINEKILDSILSNCITFSNYLNISKPNIGILALIEKINKKLPETILADSIFQKYKNETQFNVEGPISFDVAISKKSAIKKRIKSKISGKIDVLIGPSISTSNMIVKALMSAGGANGGGVILGAKCPIVLLSRSDRKITKLNSIALSLLMLQKGNYGY